MSNSYGVLASNTPALADHTPPLDTGRLLDGILCRLPGDDRDAQLNAARSVPSVLSYTTSLLALEANRLRPPATRYRALSEYDHDLRREQKHLAKTAGRRPDTRVRESHGLGEPESVEPDATPRQPNGEDDFETELAAALETAWRRHKLNRKDRRHERDEDND